MKKVFITLLYFSIIYSSFAQNKNINFAFFNNMLGEKKVIADTAFLKVAPSTGAATEDTLFLGNDINILMQVPFSEVRKNVNSPWLKITYKKGAFTKVGFISAIDVAICSALEIKNNYAIIGIQQNNRTEKFINENLKIDDNFIAKIVLINGTQKLYQDTFLIPSLTKVDSVSKFTISKCNLKRADGLIQINFATSINKDLEYSYNYIACNANLVGLNFINPNPIYTSAINISQNKLLFNSKKIIHLIVGDLVGTKQIATYKWKNCSYIKE